MLLLPLFEVLNRAEITQTSLGSLAIVEHFNVLKDPLSGFIACRIQVPVDDFLFQYGEKTLAPGIISWFANPGKALLPTHCLIHGSQHNKKIIDDHIVRQVIEEELP